ncbi:MAG: prolyl-tRNA synthetase [Candidatus Magasanikbacteria bacterium CG10_big_fil_rev_8_21_14_0_10_36_16]|uniref:Proline--tRNA ligase n=1 Tax=Candidatus Magasanikbacteria bacterium CG10_big_fil_rev_8_21_14_0_10_36_16 TaxID=1974645 RepID=A0A2H0TYU5_9BACT|nr:MAG: prolyl-tRNA synthetase [Candidatus Magasanikbacteria bacterium CG10_big_fil_rev_8_21_14_0_10_36_16]
MKQSQLFTKTRKEAPADEVSKNAQLLIRAGYIYKEMPGVYSFLPLGLRIMENIKQIIREELNNVGSQEISMTALQTKEKWEATNRWSDEVVDNWFRTQLKNGTELGLAFTHEEPIAEIMKQYVSSYKDLPFFAYQFQTKFRNELRAKSGIMRGREFLMKDLYSFHTNEETHLEFYELMKEVYIKIFTRLGIGEQTFLTMSNGQPFSKYSFEFQTLSEAGEDTILYDEKKKVAINKQDYSEEIFTDFGFKKEDFDFKEARSIEVGDIYTLGTKYSEPLGLLYTNQDGKQVSVFMGSYGIGVSRLMGTIVEVLADDKGIVWPESIAPFQIHLVSLCSEEADVKKADELYETLKKQNKEVLYDDRQGVRAGEKFADSDLIGIPLRVIISPKTLANDSVEVKKRNETKVEIITIDKLLNN